MRFVDELLWFFVKIVFVVGFEGSGGRGEDGVVSHFTPSISGWATSNTATKYSDVPEIPIFGYSNWIKSMWSRCMSWLWFLCVSVWRRNTEEDRWYRCCEGPCRCRPETFALSCWRQELEELPSSQFVPTDIRVMWVPPRSLWLTKRYP